ncbi:MAG TPA: TraR/DksA family transcriptional regulator [Thermoanaerobaculia bacterium]|nr:TraR/DksA family transcriptional regulator [Thermoanaerobaculia bacterium]
MAKAKTKSNPFQEYQEALEQKQTQLHESFQRDKAAGSAQPDDGIQDLADKAASAYSKELNFSLSDTERAVLFQVDEALARIKKGDFAICQNCGVTIGDKRLKAIPWTPHCIECQELQEQGML